MEKQMEKEILFFQMETFIKENLKMEKKMEKER
jgi:hypothetical protein